MFLNIKIIKENFGGTRAPQFPRTAYDYEYSQQNQHSLHLDKLCVISVIHKITRFTSKVAKPNKKLNTDIQRTVYEYTKYLYYPKLYSYDIRDVRVCMYQK